MKKTISAIGVAGLLISGTVAAKAQDISELTTYGIYSTLADKPSIAAGGGGLFFPIVNEVKAMGDADFQKMVLEGEKNGQIPVEAVNGKFYAEGNINYKDVYFAKWADGALAIQLPFVELGPLEVGHINYGLGSWKLDSGDKEILDAIANEVAKSGLTGIYMVGKADPLGSDEFNLALSEKRVTNAEKYLRTALENLGVMDPVIVTEFMGEFTAEGAPNKSNLEDRRVEVMIYPVK